MQKPQHMAYSGSSVTSQPGSLSHAAWQSNLSAEAAARGAARGAGGPQLVIPRAKMKPRSRYEGYNSDEDGLSAEVIIYIFLIALLNHKNYLGIFVFAKKYLNDVM